MHASWLTLDLLQVNPIYMTKKRQHERWLRLLLGIIALNLSVLSLHLLGLLPTVEAHQPEMRAHLPVAADGTVRVRLAEEVISVRIKEVDSFIFGRLPVEVKNEAMQVRIASQPVRVEVQN